MIPVDFPSSLLCISKRIRTVRTTLIIHPQTAARHLQDWRLSPLEYKIIVVLSKKDVFAFFNTLMLWKTLQCFDIFIYELDISLQARFHKIIRERDVKWLIQNVRLIGKVIKSSSSLRPVHLGPNHSFVATIPYQYKKSTHNIYRICNLGLFQI